MPATGTIATAIARSGQRTRVSLDCAFRASILREKSAGDVERHPPLRTAVNLPSLLLNRGRARRRRGVVTRDGRGGLPDRAGRIREEVARARRRRERVRPGVVAGGERRRAVAGAAGRRRARHRHGVAALRRGRTGGAEVRADERRTARGAGAERAEALRIQTVRAAGGKGRLRAAHGAERTDGRRFVTRDAGPQQTGNRNRGDDADDRDNDQQLDEGETLLTTDSHFPVLLRLSARSCPEPPRP